MWTGSLLASGIYMLNTVRRYMGHSHSSGDPVRIEILEIVLPQNRVSTLRRKPGSNQNNESSARCGLWPWRVRDLATLNPKAPNPKP